MEDLSIAVSWLGLLAFVAFLFHLYVTTPDEIKDAMCVKNTIHIQAPDQRGLDVWTDTGIWCE